MNNKRIFSWIAFGGGLAFLIACFFIWRGESTPNDIFSLNLIVAMIAYGLFFGNLFLGNTLSKNDNHKVGSMGLKWMALTSYPIAAVLVMILLASATFVLQLMVQIALLLILAAVFISVFAIDNQVQGVAKEQMAAINGVQIMKNAMSSLHDTIIEHPEVPGTYQQKLDEISQSLKFISPSDNPQAVDIESRFADTAMEIQVGIPAFHMNRERLEIALARLERLAIQRKNTYSN